MFGTYKHVLSSSGVGSKVEVEGIVERTVLIIAVYEPGSYISSLLLASHCVSV